MSAPQTKVSVYRRDVLLYERVLSPGRYIIGGSTDAEIRLQVDGVSSRHARLDLGDAEWQIVNLDDGCTTMVDDEVVKQPTIILPDQDIRVGDLHVVLDALPPAATEPGEVKVRRAPSNDILVGKKYSVGRVVAHGGMGVIKSAHEGALERDVAMKVMREPIKPGAQDRFFQEAQITAQLEHPNIVPVHELGVDEDGKPYYTMKLVRGTSLKRLLELLEADDAQAIRQWPLTALLTVFQKICDALAFAHSRNVIHRDLKPANIMLGEYGEALVMDWGLAKVLGREHLRTAPLKPISEAETEQLSSPDTTTIGPTISGTVMGTPQYMPPEQASGEVEMMDQRTDIYSLGAILYHILTLRAPFHGHTSTEVIANVRAGRIIPFAEACRQKRLPHLPGRRFPESLGAVVLKAMSREKGGRYPTVKALQVEIEAYQNGFATSAENASAWKLASLFLRRNLAVSIVAGLLLLSGLLFSVNLARAYHRAEDARLQAVASRSIANQQRNVAEDQLYLTEMLQAARQLDDGLPANARTLLDRHRQEPSGRDLRDWEWYYLSGEASQDRLRVAAHPGGVLALSATPDGARVATGGTDGDIAVWQTRGLVPQWRVSAHAGPVHAVSWHPDGKWLASGGADGCVRIWNTETHAKVTEFRVNNNQRVRTVTWQPHDGGQPELAIGGDDKDILLWHPLAEGEASHPTVLATTKNGAAALHWSPDGKILAAGEIDTGSTLEVFDIPNHEKILSSGIGVGTDVFAVAIDPAGKRVAVGSKHLMIAVFNLASKKRDYATAVHYGAVSALAWSPDGHELASASHDGTIRICVPAADEPGAEVLTGHTGAVNTLAWLKLPAAWNEAERTALVSGGSDGTLRVWLPGAIENTAISFTPPNWIAGARWDPKGARIAAVNFRDYVFIADPGSGLHIALPTSHGALFDVAWSPDGRRVATASRLRGIVEVLDTATGRLTAVYPLPRAVRVAWSPSGRYLAGAGLEQSRVWDTRTGVLRTTLLRPTSSLAWFSDERRLALGGSDGAIQVWDALAGKPLATWKTAPEAMDSSVTSQYEPPHAVFDLRWSNDTHFLAYATQDSLAGILDGTTGQRVRDLPGHSSGVWRLAWNPKDTRLATASQDGIIRIFATGSGRQVGRIAGALGPSELHAIDWSADGRAILSGGYDNHVHIWNSQRGYSIDSVDQVVNQRKPQNDDVETLSSLARIYAELGWVDDARRTLDLWHSASPNDPASRSAAADAESAFARALDTDSPDWTSSPATLLERRRSLELLRSILDNWEKGQTEAAIGAYRELAHLTSAAALLPIAQTYLGRARWTATWFPSKADPLQDPAAWRLLAHSSDAVTASVRALDFPYQFGGPRALALNDELTDRGPAAHHFSMIAHARINLPAGKWRFHVSGGGGVRLLAGDKVILDNWTADAPIEKFATYQTFATRDVDLTIEHFVLEPTPDFAFVIEPVVP
jgi:WD40 repeat protein/serine/threonine protein kinase